ncbi:MAG: hypothetical protein AAF791_09535 [Bacteroidota bacterium]
MQQALTVDAGTPQKVQPEDGCRRVAMATVGFRLGGSIGYRGGWAC